MLQMGIFVAVCLDIQVCIAKLMSLCVMQQMRRDARMVGFVLKDLGIRSRVDANQVFDRNLKFPLMKFFRVEWSFM